MLTDWKYKSKWPFTSDPLPVKTPQPKPMPKKPVVSPSKPVTSGAPNQNVKGAPSQATGVTLVVPGITTNVKNGGMTLKISLASFGTDFLKILQVALIASEAAEPIVDLTEPGIATIYNLSVQQGINTITAIMGATAPPVVQPSAPTTP